MWVSSHIENIIIIDTGPKQSIEVVHSFTIIVYGLDGEKQGNEKST